MSDVNIYLKTALIYLAVYHKKDWVWGRGFFGWLIGLGFLYLPA